MTSVIRGRDDLRYLNGTEVVVSGRVKEYRRHSKRRDLDSLLLVNISVTPRPFGESLFVHHMWFLRRQFRQIGRVPTQGERVQFVGVVYPYTRLGGKSIDRDLFGTTDYGVKPLNYAD